jgi:hypothetical protein
MATARGVMPAAGRREPRDLVAIPVEISDNIAIESFEVKALPADWRTLPAPLDKIGEQWFRGSKNGSPLSTFRRHSARAQLCANPIHREVAQLSIGRSGPFSFDPRMFQN